MSRCSILSEIKSLNSVKQLIEEGKLKEAFQIVLELEKKEHLSLKEILSLKLVKAYLLRYLGNINDAIELVEEIFREILG